VLNIKCGAGASRRIAGAGEAGYDRINTELFNLAHAGNSLARANDLIESGDNFQKMKTTPHQNLGVLVFVEELSPRVNQCSGSTKDSSMGTLNTTSEI